MNVTPAEYAQLQARAQSPVLEGWRDGALTVFVPGKPTHYKGKGHRYTVAKHTKDWRERVGSRLLARMSEAGPRRRPSWPWSDTQPKRVSFIVISRNAFDADNLELVCSPCRDALKDMALIQDDRTSAGHEFTYQNMTTRKVGAVLGISIRVELRKD
jgi:hypothetical protein